MIIILNHRLFAGGTVTLTVGCPDSLFANSRLRETANKLE